MAFESGHSLAHYRIVEKIGEGGMGEVYLARDSRLGRDVAIKVLQTGISRDPARLERFEREARALASLNHPNIVTVHSVESDSGVHFITMELLEGRTLSKAIGRGGLSLGAFLNLAIPLADALAAAHLKGITHRDLKPANIMVDTHGRLKVLDFGLAKLRETAVGADDGLSVLPTKTVEEPLTGEGRVVGTAAYMSPEQAEGKTVDNRSDIFSLGVVLYEMATGVCPFKGDTPISTVSSILRDTPSSITEVNPGMPRALGRIVRRCLAKDPGRRFQTALDVRNELEELKREIESGELAGAESIRRGRMSLKRFFLSAAILIGVVGILAVGVGRWMSGLVEQQGSRSVSVRLTKLTESPGDEEEPTLSPDGRMIAFTARGDRGKDIFLQRTDGSNAINLTADCEADDSEPAFSPDGGQIAFRSEREGGGLFLMGATGESPRRLTSFGHFPSWSPDGSSLVFSRAEVTPRLGFGRNEIWLVNVATGDTRLVMEGDASHPSWSPKGVRIACFVNNGGQRDIWTIRRDGTDPQPVTNDAATDWQPVWSPDGEYLYFASDRGGTDNIWRVRIVEASGRTLGEPEGITTGTSATEAFSMSRDGRRLASSVVSLQARLEEVGFDPVAESLVGAPSLILSAFVGAPDVSPDGRWIAYMSFHGQEDIFVTRIDGSGMRRLTDDKFRDRLPRWSPRGDRVSFYSNRSGKYEVWTIRRDGSGLRQETEVPDTDVLAPVWSPDGSLISCMMVSRDGSGHTVSFDWNEERSAPRGPGDMRPLPPIEEGSRFLPSAWSPDGRTLAGMMITGDGEVTGVLGFSPQDGQYTHLARFDESPMSEIWLWWLSDSRRIIYMHGQRLVLLDTRTGRQHVIEAPALEDREFMYYSRGTDDRHLLRVSGTYIKDIWLLDLESVK